MVAVTRPLVVAGWGVEGDVGGGQGQFGQIGRTTVICWDITLFCSFSSEIFLAGVYYHT